MAVREPRGKRGEDEQRGISGLGYGNQAYETREEKERNGGERAGLMCIARDAGLVFCFFLY